MNAQLLDAQVQLAQIDDALSVWQRRSNSYRPQVAERAAQVMRLRRELIENVAERQPCSDRRGCIDRMGTARGIDLVRRRPTKNAVGAR